MTVLMEVAMTGITFSTSTSQRGIQVVNLTGSLDVSGAAKIESELLTVAGKAKKMVIDLKGINFISSQGIRVLIATAKSMATHNHTLLLAGASPSVRKVLTFMSIDKVIPLYADVQAAEEACQ